MTTRFNLIRKFKIGSSQSPYYSLEVERGSEVFSFDLNYKYQRDLMELKKQIETVLGYDDIIKPADAKQEDIDKIMDFKISHKKLCFGCKSEKVACFECVLKQKNDIERLLFLKYRELGLTNPDREADLQKIENHKKQFDKCKKFCQFNNINCYECALICQSPLESTFYLGCVKRNLDIKLQQRINKDGSIFNHTKAVDKYNILTIPDFYLEKNGKKICLYTDGFTYHERTEEQAMRDRNIDRELQKLGFVVLRYTTKEVNQNLEEHINAIMSL